MSCMRGEKKSRLYAAVQPASPPAEPPAVVQYGLAIALGVVLGCILGLAQSMVLRRYTARAGRWIWANALAWAVGMPLIFVGMDLVPWSRGTVVIIVAIYGVCWATGLVVGAVHGWALVSLAPPAPELRPHNKARPPGPGEAPNVVQDGTPSLGRLRAEKMPASYRRVIITQPGGPEVLQILEEALPEPGPGEVRVRIVTAGVSFADLLMREGVHPETPRTPFTPGWDLVGVVDKLGAGVSTVGLGQTVAALPVIGGYAEFICLPQEELVPVPAGLDPGEAVSLVLNHVTAYQMLHRSAHVRSGQRVLVHSATGGIGTALLQLGRLVDLEVYGTASQRPPKTVSGLGGTLIDYQQVDFVEELLRLTGNGVDVVFDGIGGTHLWRSLKALRAGGKVVAYGLTSSLRGGRLVGGRRHRLRGLAIIGLSIIATFFLPGRKRMLLYSIQTLKRRRPAWFQEDLTALLELLHQGRITPMIAERIPLGEARRAHELLGRGSVTGKTVLLCER